MHLEITSHFSRCKNRTVESETVAIRLGGESVRKNAGEVGGGNSHPVIDHCDPESSSFSRDSQSDYLVGTTRFGTGGFGIAD